MLPEHRLAALLDQVKESQINNCLFHTRSTQPSLYADHMCDRSQFPSEVMLELEKHSGELWQIAFSHDGTRLAACGQDQFILIWDVSSFDMIHKIEAHQDGEISNLSFSPDGKMMVSCGMDRYAKIWDVEVGTHCRLLISKC